MDGKIDEESAEYSRVPKGLSIPFQTKMMWIR
jgi:hypothetical protein